MFQTFVNNNLITMFAKCVLIAAVIGLCGACNMGDFQDKCQKYQDHMKSMTQGKEGETPDFAELCCVIKSQLNCVSEVGCDQQLAQTLGPLKSQLSSMCGSQKPDDDCFDKYSSAGGVLPSLFTLTTALCALFKIYH